MKASSSTELTGEQLAQFKEAGFVRLPAFVDELTCRDMLARVVEIVRLQADGKAVGNALVLPEANLAGTEGPPESLVSKVFRLHRDSVFGSFASSPRITDIVATLVAPTLDCFLSQFIFKNPGAWGQPWHQDSYYFHFEPPRPVVGVWVAITEATLDNGCLHVLPGSQDEPIHTHVPDRRPGANYGYVEIVDHDMSTATPVLMDTGDVLLFDSHLMHCSTDNRSTGIRAAMVYHYAATGTVDVAPSPVNDWLTVRG